MIAELAYKFLRPLAALGAIAMGIVAVTAMSIPAAIMAAFCVAAAWAFKAEVIID